MTSDDGFRSCVAAISHRLIISVADRIGDMVVVSDLRYTDGLLSLVLAPVHLLLLIEPEQFVGGNGGAWFRGCCALGKFGR